MAEHLDARIGTTELALLALKSGLRTSSGARVENDKVLRAFRSDLPRGFGHFLVVDGSGNNIGSSEVDSSGGVLADNFAAQGKPLSYGFRIAGPLRPFGNRGSQALAVIYPLDSAGSRIIGLIPLSAIQREVLRRDIPDASLAALVRNSGEVITSSASTSYWMGRRIEIAAATGADSAGRVGTLIGQNGASLYAAYAPSEHAPLGIVVGTPESLAFAKARRDMWRAIGWGALAFFLGVLLASTQATKIIRPLYELESDAATLGAGDLNHRSRIDSSDELGRLGRSINAMAERLQRREAEALQAQKMESVGQLAGGIAHDFNNLLTVIGGRLELLASGDQLSADAQEDIGEMRGATTRAVSLTRQLLAFSRKQLLRPRVIDLNAVVDEIEPMLRRLIGEDIQIVIAREPQLERVLADSSQIHQVLMNLCLNARDAMPAGGLLRIETRNQAVSPEDEDENLPAGRYVVVSVADTGQGMDEPTKARIFDPFFTTKPAGKGTGLGLATVYGIVRQSGAKITVDTAPGRGSTFYTYFPASDAEFTGEYAVASSEDARGTETILLVEDERSVRELATKILESRGYKVIAASHGGDAMQFVQGSEQKIDLVLTDVVMPGMSGRELVENLTRLRPGIKVLYMSGYTDDEIVKRGLFDPNVDFIQKPFSAEQLGAHTREALDG